jgi:gas vesicle protein
MEDECEKVVTSAWKDAAERGAADTMSFLKAVSKDLHVWSRDILGDLQQRIKKLRKELEETRREVISDASVRMEKVVCFKLGKLEDQLDTGDNRHMYTG